MQRSKEATSLVNDYVYPFFRVCTKTNTRKVSHLSLISQVVSLGGLGAILWVLRSTFRSAAKIEDERVRSSYTLERKEGQSKEIEGRGG